MWPFKEKTLVSRKLKVISYYKAVWNMRDGTILYPDYKPEAKLIEYTDGSSYIWTPEDHISYQPFNLNGQSWARLDKNTMIPTLDIKSVEIISGPEVEFEFKQWSYKDD